MPLLRLSRQLLYFQRGLLVICADQMVRSVHSVLYSTLGSPMKDEGVVVLGVNRTHREPGPPSAICIGGSTDYSAAAGGGKLVTAPWVRKACHRGFAIVNRGCFATSNPLLLRTLCYCWHFFPVNYCVIDNLAVAEGCRQASILRISCSM